MDKLRLEYRGHALGEFALGRTPLAVGRGQGCDIVVHDSQVAEHQWLVVARRGTVVAYDLAKKQRGKSRERHLPLNQPLRIGQDYALTRVSVPDRGPQRAGGEEPPTDRIRPAVWAPPKLFLLIGRGADARRIQIEGWPLELGSAPENDVVVADRAVSRKHCRLEPGEAGLLIRDLGSLNGIYVNGARVLTAHVAVGDQVRVGHTDLRLVACEDRIAGACNDMVAESPAMLQVLGEVRRMARLSWPVLLVGESGTGKEGLAQRLHESGPRKNRSLVALNAGGLARDLVESELFGHERGAFTGAAAAHKGAFEQADGGTLFLDEIGELPLGLQTRLLRAVESGEIRRVGGEASIRVDVRLVCATHRDIRAMTEQGGFRRDLYYRLARLVVEVPPLRSRPEDMRALVTHFLRQMASEVGPHELAPESFTRLLAYSWPGNARELYNVLATACAATASPRIEVADIEAALRRVGGATASKAVTAETLRQALDDHGGNASAAARALGMARSTLRDRLKGSEAKGSVSFE